MLEEEAHAAGAYFTSSYGTSRYCEKAPFWIFQNDWSVMISRSAVNFTVPLTPVNSLIAPSPRSTPSALGSPRRAASSTTSIAS